VGGLKENTDPQLMTRLQGVRSAARELQKASAGDRDKALQAIGHSLAAHTEKIVAANARDIERAQAESMAQSLQDRLRLTPERVSGLVAALEQIRSLPDPIGDVVRGMTLANGLQISQVRVPFGVVGAIYEARPNVTVDIAALALKSGNAVLLRGGSAAENTNTYLVELMQEALASVGLPPQAISSVDDFGRAGAEAMMHARGFIDVLVPRGSAQLIETVVTTSSVPVIETGSGVVHIFVDETADLAQAIEIIHNAKVQRPSVCNALETLLVHEKVADRALPAIAKRLQASGVVLHGCPRTLAVLPEAVPASEEDWQREYLSLDLAIKVVGSLDEALSHIATYSTRHTESILTGDMEHAERFLNEVDAAVVMVNASTRFTDGGEFGFGAEVGISTQKLHARGPMGLPELTSTKWIVRGSGQVRA